MDNRYSWLVLFISASLMSLVGMTVYSMTLIYQAILVKFNMKVADTASYGGVYSSLILLTGIFGAILCQKLAVRLVIVLSAILHFLGVILAALAPSEIVFFIGYAVMGGVASGIMAYVGFMLVTMHFCKRRSLAICIFSSSINLSSFIFPPVTNILLDHYGLPGCLLLQAAFLLHAIPLALIMHPEKQVQKPETDVSLQDNKPSGDVGKDEACNNMNASVNSAPDISLSKMQGDDSPRLEPFQETLSKQTIHHQQPEIKEKRRSITDLLGFKLLQSPYFVLYLCMASSIGCAYYVPLLFFSSISKERNNLSLSSVAWLLSIEGAINFVLKFPTAASLDMKHFKRNRTCIVMIIGLLFAFAIALMPFTAYNVYALCACNSALRFFGSLAYSQLPVLLADIVDMGDFKAAYGLQRTFQGITIVAMVRLTGWLVDISGSYVWPYYVSACYLFICIIPFSTLHILWRWKKGNDVNTTN